MSRQEVEVKGTVFIEDHEPISANQTKTVPVSQKITLTDSSPSLELLKFDDCAGNEVRVTVNLIASLTSEGDIRVEGDAILFEGASCSTTDKEDEDHVTRTVPKDGSATYNADLRSSGNGGGDKAEIRLDFSNRSI